MSVAIHLFVFARVDNTYSECNTANRRQCAGGEDHSHGLSILGVMAVDECRTGAVSLGPMPVTIRRVIV